MFVTTRNYHPQTLHNAAKARDNGDFSVFENIYNEKTLKAAEKMFHTHIYSCVQHCICVSFHTDVFIITCLTF